MIKKVKFINTTYWTWNSIKLKQILQEIFKEEKNNDFFFYTKNLSIFQHKIFVIQIKNKKH